MVYDFVQSRLQRNKKDEKLLVEYGSYGEYWSSSEARGPYGVGLWKYIRGGWNSSWVSLDTMLGMVLN